MLCVILWPQNAENQPISYTFLDHVDTVFSNSRRTNNDSKMWESLSGFWLCVAPTTLQILLRKQLMFVLNNIPDHFSLSWTDCVPHFSTDCSASLSQCEVNFIRSDFEERKNDTRQTCSLQNKKIKKRRNMIHLMICAFWWLFYLNVMMSLWL